MIIDTGLIAIENVISLLKSEREKWLVLPERVSPTGPLALIDGLFSYTAHMQVWADPQLWAWGSV